MKKRIIAVVLTCALILGMIPASSSGAATQSLFQDVNGHWGQEAIERFAELGIVQGFQGKFNPDKAITRGELALVIDNIMDYQTMANNDLADLGDAFYTEAVLKVNAAKVMVGFNKRFRPTENITREEAILTLSRAFGTTLASDEVLTKFSDRSEVSSWAFEAVNSMVSEKYITGYKGTLLPKSNITRAEVVTILDNVIKALYSEKGEYSASVDGNAIINADAVTLKNLTIMGDLIITEGVADGEITLENVIVEGNTIVRGGGANSIIIKGNSKISNLMLSKTDSGAIRIKTEGNATVETIYVNDGKDDIILTGQFENVSVEGQTSVKAVNAQISNIDMNAGNATLNIDKNTKVSTIGISEDATGSAIEVSGSVENIETNAPNSNILVNGTVTNITSGEKAKESNIELSTSAKVTNMTVEANVAINNKGTISNVDVKANGVSVLGNVPVKVVVDATVTVKPVDSRGKEVTVTPTPTVVTPEPTTPTVQEPTKTKVAVVKNAEVIVKGEDDRWGWYQNGTPLLTITFPENSSVIRYYDILASKDGGAWKEIGNTMKFSDIDTEAINLTDVLTESGLYKFKIVSVAQNIDEYSNNEMVMTDTLKLTMANEEIVPEKVFTTGWDQREIGIRQLETSKLYQVYFFDVNGTKLNHSITGTPKDGAINFSRNVYAHDENDIETKTEIKSIKIRKIEATETAEGVVLIITKLQETSIPVEVNNLPIDPVDPEFGEYLPTVTDLSVVYNSTYRDELRYSLKYPTDLSEFKQTSVYLFNDESYTHIDGFGLENSVNKVELSGKQCEWTMMYGLLRQTKTASFTKMGVVSEPNEESLKLADITYVNTNITVNVADNPIVGHAASLSINETGVRVVTITGLESNKKYFVEIMEVNSGTGSLYESNSEGIITIAESYYDLDTLTEGSKLYLQKYEVIADSNGYTMNVTPRSQDGASINLNDLKPLVNPAEVDRIIINATDAVEDNPYETGDLLIQWRMPYMMEEVSGAKFFARNNITNVKIQLDDAYEYIDNFSWRYISVTGLLRNFVDNGVYTFGIDTFAKEGIDKPDNSRERIYNPVELTIQGNIINQVTSTATTTTASGTTTTVTGTTTVATETTVTASFIDGKVVVNGLESDELYLIIGYDEVGKELYYTHDVAISNSINFTPVVIGDSNEILFKIRKVTVARDTNWGDKYYVTMSPMPEDVISVTVAP
ncbi:MAG: S-layer domain protein [Clostridiales bacterium]|jgi:hypothetical protein|nr:S-layer domain protein [Clostridiales bacterium]